MKKGRVRKTDHYRIFFTHRPQTPHIEKYVDHEFEAIYINTAAGPGAKVIDMCCEKNKGGTK